MKIFGALFLAVFCFVLIVAKEREKCSSDSDCDVATECCAKSYFQKECKKLGVTGDHCQPMNITGERRSCDCSNGLFCDPNKKQCVREENKCKADIKCNSNSDCGPERCCLQSKVCQDYNRKGEKCGIYTNQNQCGECENGLKCDANGRCYTPSAPVKRNANIFRGFGKRR